MQKAFRNDPKPVTQKGKGMVVDIAPLTGAQ